MVARGKVTTHIHVSTCLVKLEGWLGCIHVIEGVGFEVGLTGRCGWKVEAAQAGSREERQIFERASCQRKPNMAPRSVSLAELSRMSADARQLVLVAARRRAPRSRDSKQSCSFGSFERSIHIHRAKELIKA